MSEDHKTTHEAMASIGGAIAEGIEIAGGGYAFALFVFNTDDGERRVHFASNADPVMLAVVLVEHLRRAGQM